jgi:threonine/homoserine/homoserine lactone efflux protein
MPVAEPVLLGPVRWGGVGTLLLTSLAVMGSPGPAAISLTAVGSAWGVRRCAPYLAGIITGTVAVLTVVAAGITATVLAVPGLQAVLTGIAIAYILWLAYHLATAPPVTTEANAGSPPALTGGILLGVANPKAWLAISAVFASTRIAPSPLADAVAKSLALTLMAVVICTAWLLTGASLTPVLRDPRRSRIMNITLAVILVGATAATSVHQFLR